MEDGTLRDEASLQWAFLDDEEDPCMVLSERMEFVYVNGAARTLVPEEWFGKRCFEVLPTVDETCAFHCPKMDAVHDSVDPKQVVYCEEVIYKGNLDRLVLGVGLIPLGEEHTDRPSGGLCPENQGRVGGCRRVRVAVTAGRWPRT